MFEYFSNNLLLDPRYGRITDVDLSVVDEEYFRFVSNKEDGRRTTISDLDDLPDGLFTEFVNLTNKAKEEWDELRKQKPIKLPSFNSILVSYIKKFAKEYGPLFGFSALKEKVSYEGLDSENEIYELISDWLSAQKLFSQINDLVLFLDGHDSLLSKIDDHITVMRRSYDDEWEFDYVYRSGINVSEKYESILKCNVQSANLTTDDGSILTYGFTTGNKGEDWTIEGIEPDGISAFFKTRYPKKIFGLDPIIEVITPVDKPVFCPLDVILQVDVWKEELLPELSSIIRIISDVHCGAISLGYHSINGAAETKEENQFQVLSSSILSYMWYRFCLSYMNKEIIQCANPKCKNIISIEANLTSRREYCCDQCRANANNAKIGQQKKIARKAYYEAKSFMEIYELAFEKKWTPKDPESRTLRTRLVRWMDDFSRTKKGQVAKKQGAGRE